ncbi:hypothetical protein [Pectobacterium brasiliense]|uniref:hypothetical protein n=1 Tax=Pectobacterium brasiliense TaxID=180957 RepID=UPI001F07FF7A|nr:hypothetical protein [Pectobacterium brasiliense]
MFIKTIEKTNHSEWVVRNSLYWMSAYTRWQLGADDNDWIVSFESFDDTIKFEFERFFIHTNPFCENPGYPSLHSLSDLAD